MTGYTHALGALATVSEVADEAATYTARVIAPDRTTDAPDCTVGSGGEWSFSVVLDQAGAWMWRVEGSDDSVSEGTLYCSPSEFDISGS